MNLASIVWDVDPVLVRIGSIELRWYGLMWGLGFILAYEIMARLFKKEGHPDTWVDKLFVYCVVSSVVGARLGHCLFYEWDYYGAHPIEILKIWTLLVLRMGLLRGASHRNPENMERRACQPWRRLLIDIGFGMVFQESNEEKRMVAFRPHDTCRGDGMYVHPLWQPDEFGNIRLSYHLALGLRICPLARMAGIV